jgi:hypothetical protein
MATWTSQRSGAWNDDAANASSPWNGGANPASGIPANTDTVTIAAGHDVEFNVDQSGFAAGITPTINGTVHASTTAGAYKMKLQANLTGSGTLRAGTEATPYPITCTFEIIRNGFILSSSTMTYDLNCTEPTIKWIKLSAQEAAGQTILSVDTDVTADAQWVNGATIRINDVNGGNDSEERTFSSATSNTITISSGLTAQKETGTYIALMTRNVRITHTSAAGAAITPRVSGSRVFAQINNAAPGVETPQNVTIGGTIHNCGSAGIDNGGSFTVSAVICATTNGIRTGIGVTVLSTSLIAGLTTGLSAALNSTSFGVIAGCVNGLSACISCQYYGTIVGCSNGINGGGGHFFSGATMNNPIEMINVGPIKFNNSLLAGATENSGYNGVNNAINGFIESIDHDQVANAYRAWTKGGIIDSDTGTVFTGRTRSFKHACATASFFAFQNRTFTVQPGGGLVVQCYVRKTVTMAYLPRVWILTPGQEPFITGSPAHEDIMLADSVDAWEELNLVYSNGGTSPVDVVVRTVAKNASGNVFFDPIVTVLAPATYDVYNTLLANVAAILVDTNELQTDWVNGGRLDNILDARASQTSVDTLDNFVDTEVTDIKAKTDQLTFTVANQLDANVQSVNDVALIGNGSTIPWGPTT